MSHAGTRFIFENKDHIMNKKTKQKKTNEQRKAVFVQTFGLDGRVGYKCDSPVMVMCKKYKGDNQFIIIDHAEKVPLQNKRTISYRCDNKLSICICEKYRNLTRSRNRKDSTKFDSRKQTLAYDECCSIKTKKVKKDSFN